MRIRRWTRPLPAASAAVVLLAVVFTALPGTPAQAPRVPVISLKTFIGVPEWQLDITWSAKEVYEDADLSAKADMKTIASFILKQSDKTDAWGRWHAEDLKSYDMGLTTFLVSKSDGSRTEYRNGDGPVLGAGADFQVGGQTPGFQLTCGASFPVKLTNPLMGTINVMQTLLTTDISGSSPIFCTGPLPSTGNSIHGSMVIPMSVPPFIGGAPPLARVGIQYVLQPHTPLGVLDPAKKK